MRVRLNTISGKLLYRLSKLLYSLTQKIWRVLIVCNYCGTDCGFHSSVSRYGFTCDYCLNRLQRNEG